MAKTNLLPILLLGGAAAYLVTKKPKDENGKVNGNGQKELGNGKKGEKESPFTPGVVNKVNSTEDLQAMDAFSKDAKIDRAVLVSSIGGPSALSKIMKMVESSAASLPDVLHASISESVLAEFPRFTEMASKGDLEKLGPSVFLGSANVPAGQAEFSLFLENKGMYDLVKSGIANIAASSPDGDVRIIDDQTIQTVADKEFFNAPMTVTVRFAYAGSDSDVEQTASKVLSVVKQKVEAFASGVVPGHFSLDSAADMALSSLAFGAGIAG